MAVGQPRYSKEGFEVDASEIAACDRRAEVNTSKINFIAFTVGLKNPITLRIAAETFYIYPLLTD